MSKEQKTPNINVSNNKKQIIYSFTLFSIFQLEITTIGIVTVVNITSGKMHSLHGEAPKITLEILEEKKAILKAEHDKQIAENMKKLHDGTYKPRPWAGFPWNREE